MIDFTPYSILLPALLYAETHYRFRYFFSYLKKNEPELLADAPHWLEPDQSLPLLIISKDAHQYPCTLLQITAQIRKNGKSIQEIQLLDSPLRLTTKYWCKIFTLDIGLTSGWIEVNVTFEIEVNGKKSIYKNDNYRTSSQAPLRVYKGKEPLPRLTNLHFGDCHTHSTYTEDQVEFGSPLEASVQLCKTLGHSFFCVTDHSYDLDDKVDTYLENDPTLPKWVHLQDTISRINAQDKTFVIVRGEEVSCRNSNGQNVHLVLLGNKTFFPGAGDSAERWLHTRSEMSIKEILQTMGENTIAFAAHPNEKVPFLQRFLLGRGQWTTQDFMNESLTGIQFVNGPQDGGFDRGYRNWISCLLKGQKVFALAGNDAHGNFNRFRQISIPFFQLRESDQQLFGKARTGVFGEGHMSEKDIINFLRMGKAIVTDGPALNIRIDNLTENTALGSTIHDRVVRILLAAKSSEDFGHFSYVRIYRGFIGSQQEELIYSNSSIKKREWETVLSIEATQQAYIRAEASTRAEEAYDNKPHFALTNPVWLNPA